MVLPLCSGTVEDRKNQEMVLEGETPPGLLALYLGWFTPMGWALTDISTGNVGLRDPHQPEISVTWTNNVSGGG